MGIYKRKQESKYTRKHPFDQERYQEKKENKKAIKKTRKKTRIRPRKEEKTFFFS